MAIEPIIADRGEFIDVLTALRRGHVLVRNGAGADEGRCLIDGSFVHSSFEALLRYGLIDEFPNPEGFATLHYFRLNERGRAFAREACAAWQRRPLLQRLAVRLTG